MLATDTITITTYTTTIHSCNIIITILMTAIGAGTTEGDSSIAPTEAQLRGGESHEC